MKRQQQSFSHEPRACCKRVASATKENLLLVAPVKRRKHDANECCEANESLECVPINSLPIEILDQVFSHLGVKQRIELDRVCKHWRRMGRQLRWQWPTCLGLRIKRPHLAVCAAEEILFRCGNNLRKLQVLMESNDEETGQYVSRRTIDMIAQYCPNLEYINLGQLQLTSLCLKTLAEGCPKLKGVCLDESSGYNESRLIDLLELCQDLECLDVSGPITGRCLSSVSSKLQILRLRSETFSDVGLESVMKRCPHVRELRISGRSLPKLDLTTFLEKYKDTLTVLDLEGPYSFPLYYVLRVLQNLETLCLVECCHVNDGVMTILSRECHNLKVVSIGKSQITDLGLSQLSSLPYLKVLDVSDNSINGAGVKHIAMEGRLEELRARSTTPQPNYFIEWARLCPNLRLVDLSHNREISNWVVEAFCEAINAGYVKGPLKFFAVDTSVDILVKQCDRLQLHFRDDPCYSGIWNGLHAIPYSIGI